MMAMLAKFCLRKNDRNGSTKYSSEAAQRAAFMACSEEELDDCGSTVRNKAAEEEKVRLIRDQWTLISRFTY